MGETQNTGIDLSLLGSLKSYFNRLYFLNLFSLTLHSDF